MRHNMRRLLALALWLCVGASPAFALAITQISGTGTGGSIANVTFSGTTSVNLTTTAAIGPGNLAVAIVQTYGSSPTLGCSDAYGNTWQAAPNGAFRANAGTQFWYSITTNTIPNAGTVTCTDTSGIGFTGALLAFAGVGNYDVSPTGVTGSGTSVTVGPSPTLSCPGGGAGCEVCVAGAIWNSTGTTTIDATWTATSTTSSSSWANGFKIVNATTALSFTSSTTATQAFAGAMACFKVATNSYGGGTTVGVGH